MKKGAPAVVARQCASYLALEGERATGWSTDSASLLLGRSEAHRWCVVRTSNLANTTQSKPRERA
jgi:hypothetical protein